MSSADKRGLESRSLGLRIGLWYATLFIAGSVAIVLLTYALTSNSLAQRDRQIINQKLGEYASVYGRGGIRALEATIQAEQQTAPERLFVRVVGLQADVIVSNLPEGLDPATLETGSIQLSDGTIVEVGKSTDARQDLLARFRAVLGLVTLTVFVVALTGGWLATQSALQPIRRLIGVVEEIVRTGRTGERVPVPRHDDAIHQLTALFNAMLDKIDGLVNGMRGALDNVSHDLRTPLTRLRGTAELALGGPPDVERYRDALADCVEESDRVLVMLNTLMDISEAESGAMPLSREPIRLADVAERALDLYRDVADARDISLDAGQSSDVHVSGDRVRLEQVAANLVDNALKYTPPGGRVTVDVSREGSRAVLRVCDTGAGIREDELPRIWERLFRGDTSRTERGLGLGLSLVKAVVEAHGGAVSVESTSDRGSTFSVTMPALSA